MSELAPWTTSKSLAGLSDVSVAGEKAGDLLTFDGKSWVALHRGSTAQQMIVHSDGTITYEDAPKISAKAWGAKFDGATNDRPALQTALDFAAEKKAVVKCPGGTAIIAGGTLEGDSYSGLEAEGPGLTRLKNAAANNASIFKSKRLGEGGENGGTDHGILRSIGFDSNFAENPGLVDPVVNLDGIRPLVKDIEVIGGGPCMLRSQMSRNEKSSSRLEDGVFSGIGLFGGTEFNFLFEGPHDSHISDVLAQTNGENCVSLAARKVSIWQRCHAYGNAKFPWELRGGIMLDTCVGEGGRVAQILLAGDSNRLYNCRFFSAGALDGKIGIQFGDETHTANTQLISGVWIEGCINGSLNFVKAGSNSRISGIASQASGKVAVGTPKNSVHAMGLEVTGGAEDNLNVREREVANTLSELPFAPVVRLTKGGVKEVKKLPVTFRGHVVVLVNATGEEIKIVAGEEIKIPATKALAANECITLACDGTNWYGPA